MAREYVSIWRGDLRVAYSSVIPFLLGKTFHTQGENWGPLEGIVSAAPAQANKIIKYCI